MQNTIKAEAVYQQVTKKEKKFDHFKLTLGTTVIEPIPIGFIRKSELPVLEKLLKQAYEMGFYDGENSQRGSER